MAKSDVMKPQSIEAITVYKTPLGWVSAVLIIEGDKIVKRIEREPDLRAVALAHLSQSINRFWADEG